MSATVTPLPTHCSAGHEFTPENTYIYDRPTGPQSRLCRKCRARSRAKHRDVTTKSIPHATLDRAALRRLLDAKRDGVALGDLCDRFSLTHEQLVERLKDAEAMEAADAVSPSL